MVLLTKSKKNEPFWKVALVVALLFNSGVVCLMLVLFVVHCFNKINPGAVCCIFLFLFSYI